MDYPFWDSGVGYGPLMAAVAIVHVFISHFAIGGGLYLVVSEHLARRRGDRQALAFLEELTRFFVLVTLVLGALTGVAIWFVIGLLDLGRHVLRRLGLQASYDPADPMVRPCHAGKTGDDGPAGLPPAS